MNTLIFYFIEVIATLAVCLLTVRYLRPHLQRILTDLCGTEDRARFWTVFSNILLVGLPMIISFSFEPEARTIEAAFYEVIGRLSGNLAGFLIALVGIGIMVSFFSLVGPRPTNAGAK